MWLQYLLWSDRVIVEKPIGGKRVVPAFAARVDTGFRVGRQRFDDLLAPFVQTYVPQVNPQQLVAIPSHMIWLHAVLADQFCLQPLRKSRAGWEYSFGGRMGLVYK